MHLFRWRRTPRYQGFNVRPLMVKVVAKVLEIKILEKESVTGDDQSTLVGEIHAGDTKVETKFDAANGPRPRLVGLRPVANDVDQMMTHFAAINIAAVACHRLAVRIRPASMFLSPVFIMKYKVLLL